MRLRKFGVLTAMLLWNLIASGSGQAETTARRMERSDAVFRGSVEKIQSFERDGSIWTRATLRVLETFKGKLPVSIELTCVGGQLRDKGAHVSSSPKLRAGEERVFFVSKGKCGRPELAFGPASAVRVQPGEKSTLLQELRSTAAPMTGEDFTSSAAAVPAQTATEGPGFETEPLMGAARLIQSDGGGRIPYFVDKDYIPAGLTVSQTVWAVTSALEAWSNASSARFEFAGFQSFGTAARNIAETNSILRIQLHDAYGILGSWQLGEGGRDWVAATNLDWTTGGKIASKDFHKVTRGYITLSHTNSIMKKLTTFAEVLAHEIGHVLGLEDSSYSPFETDVLRKDALMYYYVHDDGRGARLNDWDIGQVRSIHPLNTPPACLNRYLDVVTSPTIPLAIPGVNAVQPAYDLQTSQLQIQMTNATSMYGTFYSAEGKVIYVPREAFNDSGRYDPSTGMDFDRVLVRASDGTNASPWAQVAVTSFSLDSHNQGIPNSWREGWFNSPDPTPGSEPGNDPDEDGYSNLQEYWMDSSPLDATSNLRVISMASTNFLFFGRAYDVYRIFRSTDLSTWALDGCVAAPDVIGSVAVNPFRSEKAFYRLERLQ